MAVRARPDNLTLDHPGGVEAVASSLDFQELWEHRDDVRAACRRLVGDDSTADDVVQETFLRAITHAERLDRRSSFAPWLATVARRRSIDRLRADARVRVVAAPPEQSSSMGGDPLEHVLQQERVDRVRAALAALSVRERQLLLRQIAHGLSLAELAAEEATSIASVRSVLSRARTKLRTSIERGGPLGAAPMPGLVAALKRRLHRLAARLEGSTPMLAGAGVQFGDVVVIAVTAAALLLAGGVPAPPRPTTIAMADGVQASEHRPAASGPADRPAPGRGPDRDRDAPPSPREERQPDDRPVLQPPPVHLPGMPEDGADQPEEVFVQHVAASADGRTLVISGNKEVAAGSLGGQGLYRSDDGGHTWRWLEAGGYVVGYPLLPPGFRGQRTVFVVSGPVLLRSDDGGEHFEPVAPARGGVAAVSHDRADGRIFLAQAGLAAYDAHDGTTTPYRAAPTSTTVGGLAVRISRSSEPTFLVGTALPTSDGGSDQGYVQRCTPTSCDTPFVLPGMQRAPSTLLAHSSPGLALAWFGNRLYRSVDDGRTFASVAMPSNGAILTIVEGAPGELLLARTNPGNSASSGLLRSVDRGATWTPMAVGTPLQQGVEGLAYLATGRIVAGLDGRPGFRCSADGGVTWSPRCPA